MVAVPEPMPQSFHVDLGMAEWDEERRLEGKQALHDLLDIVHVHEQVKPVQNLFY